MSLFNFSVEEFLTFFAVLVRYSVLFATLPFLGDRAIPAPIKILGSLVLSFALFPALVVSREIDPNAAKVWANSVSGISTMVAGEVLFGLALGFTAKIVFEGISLGANLVGNFMGFATASSYDPHQEAQTGIIAQIQTALAMLIFLALDGHHLMLRAFLGSYRIVGLGRTSFSGVFAQRLVQMVGEIFHFGLQMSAPVAISLFGVNVIFGILSKAMPQLNVFVLSFAVSALIGFLVMYLCVPEYQGSMSNILNKMIDWMNSAMVSLAFKEGR